MKTISGSTRWGPGNCKFPEPFPDPIRKLKDHVKLLKIGILVKNIYI
jgi:hypothetical protein